jgi:hypothetical protein
MDFFRSYGILLTEIFSNGSAPYCGKSNQQVRDEVCDGRLPQFKFFSRANVLSFFFKQAITE